MYFFDSALLLQPNTKYFFYADASGLLTGYSDVAGENVYFTFSGVSPFVASFADANYRLTGQVVQAIPEPSSLLLSGIGALGLIGYGWRSRRNNYV
jgi:hypothetical protein